MLALKSNLSTTELRHSIIRGAVRVKEVETGCDALPYFIGNDHEADGKQRLLLAFASPVHRSAYGWIPIPIVQIKNGVGPTLLLMAGNHGDEYEGQVAVTRLAKELNPEMIRGRVILLPMANFPAAKAGHRTSPIDNGNLNRSFPETLQAR